MRAFFKGAILAASASLLLACGGGDPIAKALGHQEKALGILESNKDNPEKAGDELSKYVEANKADLDAIKAQAKEMEAKFEKDPAAAMELMAKHGEKLGAMMKKLTDLRTNHAALFENEKVKAAMESLEGGM
jgi:hypothetical protein